MHHHDQQTESVRHVLASTYPDARCELLARDPWELLVATILSVRTHDQQVNQVMAVLNEHLVGIDAYAALTPPDLAKLIRKVPLYHQKARAIVEAARALIRLHHGQVPDREQALHALPGVGRKVAAVVLGNAFGVPAIAADVHVTRIVHRLGWIAAEHPLDAERALQQRFPPQQWVKLCHQFIRLGREYCKRTAPRCGRCPLAAWCAKQGVTPG
jgi:endonuclease-3